MSTRPGQALVDRLLRVGTSTLGHIRDSGLIGDLSPLTRPQHLAGPAVTVRISEVDAIGVGDAIDASEPGDVLVVHQPADANRACFGGVLAARAKAAGIAGVIVSGNICDYDQLVEYGLPVYFRSITPRVSWRSGRPAMLNQPVQVGSVTISPGDVVFGDSDGIAVLSPFEVEAVLDVLEGKERDEEVLRAKFLAGARIAIPGTAGEDTDPGGLR